jgi:hypothetical protein
MKKIFIMLLVLIIGSLTACGNNAEDATTGNQKINEPQNNSSSEFNVTDAYEILFDFIIRQDLNGVDASIAQKYFSVDVTWDGLDFKGASVFTREVQHHSGRYDVQEDVVISGSLSADKKSIESLSFRNERTGEIYEMLELELENIPYTDDNPYPDDCFKFYVREGADSLAEHLKVWNEQTREGGDVTDITTKFETLEKYEQEVEVAVSFYFN